MDNQSLAALKVFLLSLKSEELRTAIDEDVLNKRKMDPGASTHQKNEGTFDKLLDMGINKIKHMKDAKKDQAESKINNEQTATTEKESTEKINPFKNS